MKESDIRDRDVLAKYLQLVRQDSLKFFGQAGALAVVPCPACGSSEMTEEFQKDGFGYASCTECQTLYARNRPSPEALNSFYASSDSTAFWVNEFFKPKAEARRTKIFRPRAEYVATRLGPDPGWLIGDVGAGFGLFVQEMRKLWPASSYVAIEPSAEQAAICRKAGIETEERVLEELEGYDEKFDLLCAFELIEHLRAPGVFLGAIKKILKPGGVLLATTLNGLGFDIQVLWEASQSVYPPHHLNFLNPGSLRLLLQNTGFSVTEIETPGRLDWDIVEGATLGGQADPGRFFRMFAQQGSPEAKAELQQWLARNRLSSHMRALARKDKPL